tara:strand:+ start:395 stop:1507 length:1113 start_codon:yes stop_codon:yes gene_type:complete
LINEFLIPPGFNDNVTFEAYVEHKYKNTIINYFKSNGFDLIKTPLVEFSNENDDNNFIFSRKKNEDELKIRNDITPQIIRVASSRLSKKKRPLKLCYYGEVLRKKGSMLRPERQFLQVGAEIIGSSNLQADTEIISSAFNSLTNIGIKNITIEISSKIFLEVFFKKLKDKNLESLLKESIKIKDLKKCMSFLKNENSKTYLNNIFLCTGNFPVVEDKLHLIEVDSVTKKEILNIRNLIKSLENLNFENFNLDFTELVEKKYHEGLKFTFFAKNVRGEVASGGRYKIINNSLEETATGFTCYMDTVLRASTFENLAKKILVPYSTSSDLKEKLIEEGYVLFSIFDKSVDLAKDAKEYGCSYYLKDLKVIKI